MATFVLELFQLGARLMSRQTSAHPLNETVYVCSPATMGPMYVDGLA